MNINCLKFDESIVEGWLNPDNHDRGIGWMDSEHPSRIVMKDFNPTPAKFPCSLDNLNAVRQMCFVTQVNSGGGLVEADVITRTDVNEKPIQYIREIGKFPMKPHGMAYKSALYIPLADSHFIIRVWCFEVGVTGMRDAVIVEKLQSEGLNIDPTKPDWGGWWVDPYGLGPAPILMNMSEDAKYDEMFPEHPLSITRNYLRHIEASLSLDPNAAPNTVQSPHQKKKGWFGGLFGGKN